MATVVFTAVGAVLGGPVGAVIGAIAGSQIDAAIFKPGDRQGPRLQDLTVSTSVYGAALPRHFGKMRVGGSVIWSTDLIEHTSTSGGGKTSPSVTRYSYTASFAVALASRPILGVGRIWADGKLLRGAAGDMKTGGRFRLHSGRGDQRVDPLVASWRGSDGCPAFRGLAYVVFEDLQLEEFGNRIPGLSFEIFCDEGELSLSNLFDGQMEQVEAEIPLTGILGYTGAESLVDTLEQFQPVMPLLYDAGGERLVIASDAKPPPPIALGEPAISASQGDFGGKAGFTRNRAPAHEAPPRVLRYYDLDLDYQPGSQRAAGKAGIGQPRTIHLPACLSGEGAFRLISKAARNLGWAQETIAWRCAELDPAVRPGCVVTLADLGGLWRVNEWEWRASGVELKLHRLSPTVDLAMAEASSGQALLAQDLAITGTLLRAFELPWSGQGSADTSNIYAALSSSSAGWKGAAVYADSGNGQLTRIGSSNRQRAIIGTCQSTLPTSSPCLIDRSGTVTVKLVDPAMGLSSASPEALCQGTNKALVGREIIQFGRATALGGGLWRLEHLWRGRGGTEGAMADHSANEPFVLLDDALLALDSATIGNSPSLQIAAIGLGDSEAVQAQISNRGIGLRPLSPVHPVAHLHTSGDLTLGWTRRARGAWQWPDGVDVALQEEAEKYLIGFGDPDAPLRIWETVTSSITIPSGDVAALRSQKPDGHFWACQIGTHALSEALLLA